MRERLEIPPTAIMLRRELLALGYDDRAIQRRLRAGIWHRVRHGAYVDKTFWERLDELDRHRVLCRAVLRTAHPAAVLSHVSAAVEHGAPIWELDLSRVHLTRADGRSGRREAGVVHHRNELPADHVVELNGVRATTPARVFVEVSTIATVEQTLVPGNWLMKAAAVDPAALVDLADRYRHWPSSISTRIAIGLADARNSWPGEARLSYLLWQAGLHHHFEPQLKVYDETGSVRAAVDFADPESGIFLEFDGRIKYDASWRGDDKTLEEFLHEEKTREELICKLTGWTCIRIRWADLASPQLLARRIRQIMQARRRAYAV